MAHIARLRVFPIKSLDGHEREQARLIGPGALEGDRVYAICDPEGEPVTGKRDPGVHYIQATHNPSRDEVTLTRDDGDRRVFSLDADRGELNAWLSTALDRPIQVLKNSDGGHPDNTTDYGPTIVSTATLRRVAGWFDLSVHDVRRRFRANVEIGGVQPFWEDGIYDPDGEGTLEIGGTRLGVTGPLRRCIVPARDPDTGEAIPDFQPKLVGHRRASRPAWAPPGALEEHFRLAVTTAVPDQPNRVLSVGDPVTVNSEF